MLRETQNVYMSITVWLKCYKKEKKRVDHHLLLFRLREQGPRAHQMHRNRRREELRAGARTSTWGGWLQSVVAFRLDDQ